MKRSTFDEIYYDKFFVHINRIAPALNSFFSWCYENHFFDNLTEEDLFYFLTQKDVCLPLLKQHGITIGINAWDDYCRIGIDPSKCFNKTNQCSIILKPARSTREKKHIYSLLNQLVDPKASMRKTWFKAAPAEFYGGFYSNVY